MLSSLYKNKYLNLLSKTVIMDLMTEIADNRSEQLNTILSMVPTTTSHGKAIRINELADAEHHKLETKDIAKNLWIFKYNYSDMSIDNDYANIFANITKISNKINETINKYDNDELELIYYHERLSKNGYTDLATKIENGEYTTKQVRDEIKNLRNEYRSLYQTINMMQERSSTPEKAKNNRNKILYEMDNPLLTKIIKDYKVKSESGQAAKLLMTNIKKDLDKYFDKISLILIDGKNRDSMLKYFLYKNIITICGKDRKCKILIKELIDNNVDIDSIKDFKNYIHVDDIINYVTAQRQDLPTVDTVMYRCINGYNSYAVTQKKYIKKPYCSIAEIVIRDDAIYPIDIEDAPYPYDNGVKTIETMNSLSQYYMTGYKDDNVDNFVRYFLFSNIQRKIFIYDVANFLNNYNSNGRNYFYDLARGFGTECYLNGSMFIFIFKPWPKSKNNPRRELFYKDLYLEILKYDSSITIDFYNSHVFCIDTTMAIDGYNNDQPCINISRDEYISSGNDDFVFWYMACIICKPLIVASPSTCYAKHIIEKKIFFMTEDKQVIGSQGSIEVKRLINDINALQKTCKLRTNISQLFINEDDGYRFKFRDPMDSGNVVLRITSTNINDHIKDFYEQIKWNGHKRSDDYDVYSVIRNKLLVTESTSVDIKKQRNHNDNIFYLFSQNGNVIDYEQFILQYLHLQRLHYNSVEIGINIDKMLENLSINTK